MVTKEIEEFIGHILSKSKKQITAKCYRSDLIQFERFCEANGKALLAATKEDVEKFIGCSGFSPSTIRRKVASLSVFYNWCVAKGLIAQKPVSHKELNLPTIVRNPAHLSQEEETILFDNIRCEDPFLLHRDKTLARLCRQGLRLQTILDSEMNTANDLSKIPGVEQDFMNYLSERQKKWPQITEPKIFLNKHGRPLSSRSVRRKIGAYGLKAGLDGINPRALKNTHKLSVAAGS